MIGIPTFASLTYKLELARYYRRYVIHIGYDGPSGVCDVESVSESAPSCVDELYRSARRARLVW